MYWLFINYSNCEILTVCQHYGCDGIDYIVTFQDENDDNSMDVDRGIAADSLSVDSTSPDGVQAQIGGTPKRSVSTRTARSNRRRKDPGGWEVLEGLRSGRQGEEQPSRFDGYMMKTRKRPLKGWHKVSLCVFCFT